MISIVIPTYNESLLIESTLIKLHSVLALGDEIIVVDGLSEDNTGKIVEKFSGVQLISSRRGRSAQMNAGADIAKGDYILFQHADVLLDENCLYALKNHIKDDGIVWGWFSFRLDSSGFIYRVLERGSNLRNRLTGIPLGDHGIFVRKDVFHKIGGFPDIPIMEDIEFIKKIKNLAKGIEIKTPIVISARRFEKSGILGTLIRMWILRIFYLFGMSPEKLAPYYCNIR